MKKLSCCITFDFDAISLWLGSFGSNDPSTLSRGEFGAVAVPRILALLKKYNISSAWCVPGHTALAYPNLICQILDDGHEIVHHGWVHEGIAGLDRDSEKDILEKGFDALKKVAGITPVGFRSPAWEFSSNTLSLLEEYGFLYDSSCMGHDSFPYYLRRGDKWSKTDAYHFGELSSIVEMPVTWGLDDFPAFEVCYGESPGYASPSNVLEIWQGDFDYALDNAPGGVFILTLHPQVIGRGHRMLMLEKLFQHMTEKEGVTFETMEVYARRWKAGNTDSPV
tara:strand:+ start:4802 stop:5641 length:840 start_codon:yes stop_codon:yes gene_type:complete